MGNYKCVLLSLVLFFTFYAIAYSQNVGIGTTSPASKLDVSGGLTVGTSYAGTNAAPANGALIEGSVGIGTVLPTQALDVNGQIRMRTGAASGYIPVSDANGVMTWTDPAGLVSGNTLDQAYDEGGSGAGRTITADAGIVSIQGTDGLEVTGTLGSGASINSATGPRMFFNPSKAAFRAGNTNGSEWDDPNVGAWSFATGNSTTASGTSSIAMGNNTMASGDTSTAIGSNAAAFGIGSIALGSGTLASHDYSLALGYNTTASEIHATAMGYGTLAGGIVSTAMGFGTTASGQYSTAMGESTVASGDGSTSMGKNAWAVSDNATSMGLNTVAGGMSSLAMGESTNASGQNATAMGLNTTASAILSTAMGNGTTASGQFSTAFGETTGASGDNSTAMGKGTFAVGVGATAMGLNTMAVGISSTAMGDGTTANGDYTTVMGYNTTAGGISSTAMGTGTVASGVASMAMGSFTSASGDYSLAMGTNSTASGSSAVSIGSNNIASGATSTALGNNNTASGSNSFGAGTGNNTVGTASFAAGQSNIAEGDRSATIGRSNTVFGAEGQAFGTGLISNAFNEIVLGRYNNDIPANDPTSWDVNDRIFSIGNGSIGSLRSNAIVVMKNGNVGIGANTPGALLDVRGTAVFNEDGGNNDFRIEGDNKTHLFFTDASTDRIGIGNTSPLFDLHVGDGTLTAINTADTRIVSSNNTNSNRAAFLTHARDGAGNRIEGQFESDGQFNDAIIFGSSSSHPVYFRTGNATRMVLSGAGRLAIGNFTASYDLHMANNSAAKPTSPDWTVPSDERLKRDVHPFTDGLNTLQQINPVWFTYNGEAGMPQESGVGTVAQELQTVAPYMVDSWTYVGEEGESTEYLGVNYGPMYFIIINAIKEQQEVIVSQAEMIETMKKQINELQQKNLLGSQ